MIRVAYFSADTGEVNSILTAPSLEGMPEAAREMLATLTDYQGPLPAVWNGSEVEAIPESPGDGHLWDWSSRAWQPNQGLLESYAGALLRGALARVDDAAGRTRLKYITSVPGQAETYQRKEQQAREWAAAGFTGDAPSFIAAEAQALNLDPINVATEVIQLADYWANVKGPEIEATRRKWKVAIEEAGTDIDAITAARDAGISALGAL